jgi:hypothetical protein
LTCAGRLGIIPGSKIVIKLESEQVLKLTTLRLSNFELLTACVEEKRSGRPAAPGAACDASGGDEWERLASGNWLRIGRDDALLAVHADRAVNDGATVDAFPCVEDEEEVGEPLQHHQTFASRTVHDILLLDDFEHGGK